MYYVMAKELAFVLINPYTIAKSRTGGVIARVIGRTDLDFVGGRMIGPSADLVRRYADLVRNADPDHLDTCELIAEYVGKNYAPDPVTGRTRRVMLLLFEGEDAIRKIWQLTGSATLRWGSGETIRDTYGDFIADGQEGVQYFEPAVLASPNKSRAAATLALWAKHSEADGGIIEMGADVPEGEDVEKTLVLIKPDNFRFPSSRPGNIIDLLSSSGLRIVAVKRLCMTVAQAEQFYGPVRDALQSKFDTIGAERVAGALKREFGFDVPEDALAQLCQKLGPLFATSQFDNIVEFMTGYKPSKCTEGEKSIRGKECCLGLVYEGVDAVRKIRSILGPTDPSQAKPGSVRREFGSDVMVNAAHASDSVENAEREMAIINIAEDTIKPLVDKYYGNVFKRIASRGAKLSRVRYDLLNMLSRSGKDDA